jgi:Citrate synthase
MTGYTLAYEGGSLPLPTRPATEGPGGLEVGGLLTKTGHVTLDAGFMNTAACTSAITYIDGDAGILRYRGYPIDQLAGRASFLEVTYLLIYGTLPTADELAGFTERVRMHTLLREEMRRFFDGFPRDAHPMAVLSSAVSALSTFYQDSLDPFDREQVEISTVRLLAKLPTIASYAYKGSIGSRSCTRTTRWVRRELPADDVRGTDDAVRARSGARPGARPAVRAARRPRAELLHLDRALVGSAQASMFASVSAGVNALSGRCTAGANESVLEMLKQIHAAGDDAESLWTKSSPSRPVPA